MSLPLGRCGPAPGHAAWLVEYGLDISLHLLPRPTALEQGTACSPAALGREPLSCCLTLPCTHLLPLFPAPWAWQPGERRPVDTSHPDRLQPPCRAPHPHSPRMGGCTGCRRLQVLSPWPLALAEMRRPLPGHSLSAPIISPLGVAGEQGLSSVRVSRNRFASTLCDLSYISVLSWAWLMLRDAVASPGEAKALGRGQGGFLE